jgi:excisionase family DNA binding protein
MDEVCTVAETARRLRVDRRTVLAGVEAGDIPAVRLGPRSLRIPARWVNEQVNGSK